jgi:nitrile hydratase
MTKDTDPIPGDSNDEHRHHSHDHSHDHDHHHDNDLDPFAARVRALETILTEKGLIDPAAVDAILETYEHKVGPRNGARVVARAWVDPDFAGWLVRDATAAIASLGYSGRQGEHMQAVFNTPERHNLIVCTLCSCYPWTVLGVPPTWYKAPAYRSQAVIDPRGVLAEFGLILPEATRIRVWDSTAELRYMVVPMRPEETDGMSEDELARLVTRDSMIGTGLPLRPGSLDPRALWPAAGAADSLGGKT